jgi:hypothetical protein
VRWGSSDDDGDVDEEDDEEEQDEGDILLIELSAERQLGTKMNGGG